MPTYSGPSSSSFDVVVIPIVNAFARFGSPGPSPGPSLLFVNTEAGIFKYALLAFDVELVKRTHFLLLIPKFRNSI